MYRNLQDYIEAESTWLLRDSISPEQLRKLYWDKRKSVPEIARLNGIGKQSLYEQMRKFQIPRRDSRETSYLYYSKTKPQFQPKIKLSAKDEKLKIAGIMLYWAEGAKTGHTVDFSNSDPEMIQLFLRFLRKVCGVSELRLRVLLYHHGTPQQVKSSLQFWHGLTKISLNQFSRPYIRIGNPHWSGRIMAHGLLHIRYSDTRLLELIRRWISEYTNSFKGAGTRVAKGASL